MKSREQIYEFMNTYMLGVISTISQEGLPGAAVVGFGQTKDLQVLVGTNASSRKYQNLKSNPHVAFTIGGKTAETIQIEGVAHELPPDEIDVVKENYWQKNPHAEVYSYDSSYMLLCVFLVVGFENLR
jgi:general stress protein 26